MLDTHWTEWAPLEECMETARIPPEPGLYRIRARGDELLAYVGQTGRTLRERLRSLRGVYAAEMPYRDPHTAAPALWAWVQDAGVQLEASVRAVPRETPARKALEAVAIAQHRQQHGVSPRWNFGRMPAGFRMSSANNSRLVAAGKRFRGGPCEDPLPSHAAGVAPRGPLDADVQGPAWGGHQWSPWRPLAAAEIAEVPATSGLYRIRGSNERLVYAGEGQVRHRLAAHATKLQHQTEQGAVFAASGPLEFSAVLDASWLPNQRLELETDLIAAHTLASGVPPSAQFIG
jgi:hypothetical protein